jgi:hypothetical protein
VITHPAKPVGYNGAVAFYMVSDEAPADHSALTRSRLLTRSRETLTFEDAHLGRTLYIALRWENRKGTLGPWSPIQSKVIA